MPAVRPFFAGLSMGCAWSEARGEGGGEFSVSLHLPLGRERRGGDACCGAQGRAMPLPPDSTHDGGDWDTGGSASALTGASTGTLIGSRGLLLYWNAALACALVLISVLRSAGEGAGELGRGESTWGTVMVMGTKGLLLYWNTASAAVKRGALDVCGDGGGEVVGLGLRLALGLGLEG